MISLRRSEARRHIQEEGHDTWMGFDGEQPLDPLSGGFHGLRSFNEELLAPGYGFQLHTHRNTEIVTYVSEGVISDAGSSDQAWHIGTGEVLCANARRGARHLAFNKIQDR